MPLVPDYLIWGILEAFLCCLPLGIAAIIYAAQANTSKSLGRYAEALQQARTAKQCIIWGVVLWGVGSVLYLLWIGFLLIFVRKVHV